MPAPAILFAGDKKAAALMSKHDPAAMQKALNL